jgi:hypothetical protein
VEEIKGLCGGVHKYAAQENPKIAFVRVGEFSTLVPLNGVGILAYQNHAI